ncbi:MAG: CRTAC1 family protein [candidate division WOR-3 bacterium]
MVYTNLYGAPAPNTYLFRNDGNLHFTDVTDSVGLTPRMRTNYTYFVDYNNDGFLDVFWARYDGSTYHYEFFENGGNSNHWLELDLVGNYPNTNAIGARIDAWAGELYLVREVLHNQGMHYGDAFIARQHLGLGGASRVDSLIIRWPDRTSQRLYNLPVDTILQITQSQPGVEEKSPITLPVRFVNKTALSGINGLLFDVTGRRTNPIGVKAGIFYLRTPDSNRWVKLVLY